jgi:hypothetical protein
VGKLRLVSVLEHHVARTDLKLQLLSLSFDIEEGDIVLNATELPGGVWEVCASVLQEGHRSVSLGEEGEGSLIRVVLELRDIIRGPGVLSLLKSVFQVTISHMVVAGNSDWFIRSPVEGAWNGEADLEGVDVGGIIGVIQVGVWKLLQGIAEVKVLLDFPAFWS